jgi:hypothetical protein
LKRFQKALTSISILLLSTFISLIAGEFVCRIVFNKVDYLSPLRKPDPILMYRILPGSGGHDEWGFRNSDVPAEASIITIGDSQTYGNNATMNKAYPQQLSEITKQRVYNMAMGGYGPLQYEHLLQSLAPALNPKIIVVGLYFGNDIADAYKAAYSLDYWKSYRAPAQPDSTSGHSVPETYLNEFQKEPKNVIARTRHWLGGNSIFYQLVTKVLLANLGIWKDVNEIENSNDISVQIKNSDITKVLTPDTRLKSLDTSTVIVKEGLRITLKALNNMHDFCNQKKYKMIVHIIPTAEHVYYPFLELTGDQTKMSGLQYLSQCEKHLTEQLCDSLKTSGIHFINSTESLRKALQSGIRIYPSGPDGHPNEKGYQIIAETSAKHID